ncbi:hypothetical protein J0J29_23455, partial [Vibrio vulnificus]|uniref:hypothetical protein n=1 Tax=Vibrio vulnificus TaxID=672 RepID=UPI0019D44EB4
GTVSIIFLKKITVPVYYAGAKVEKLACEGGISGNVQSIRDKGTITSPKIAVMIGCPFGYIVIICRQNGTVIINLCANYQQ